ncbi:MAG TPA: prepilin-type N-terminal cleavage/methylation domain-containing protein [Candidatus Wallbacteria bacterium]|nr:prepilin-type N-terminal cleavage/methylation domain-containing protein [Candidatus Wallbacteria bacterium]
MRKNGFTAVELIVSLMIFSFVISGFYGILQLTAGTNKSSLKNKIEVQKDARRTQIKFIDELSCASEVVKPGIGSSSPFLVVIDKDGKIAVYYQKSEDFKQEDGSVIKGFKLYSVTKNPTTGKVESEREVASNIKRLVFTSASEGSIGINLTTFNKNEEISVLTQVTLKNYYAGEFIN